MSNSVFFFAILQFFSHFCAFLSVRVSFVFCPPSIFVKEFFYNTQNFHTVISYLCLLLSLLRPIKFSIFIPKNTSGGHSLNRKSIQPHRRPYCFDNILIIMNCTFRQRCRHSANKACPQAHYHTPTKTCQNTTLLKQQSVLINTPRERRTFFLQDVR